MTKSTTSLSKGENFYLYDNETGYFFLLHPKLKNILKNKTEDADPYYLKKYQYLKNNGFFKSSKLTEFEASIDESIIREGIIQSRQIVFETTDFCNLQCTYCSLGDLYTFNKKGKKNIEIDKVLKLLKYIFNLKPSNSILSISFFGGEPLLNISFIKSIIEESNRLNKDKKLDIHFNMTTNATLIHKHIDFLAENNIQLLISLDGNELAQSYRVTKDNTSSFQQVIANIDMIKAKYPNYFNDKINFNSVLHDKNSVQEIYEFIYTRYHKIPIISPLNTGYVNPSKKDCLKKMFHSRRESEEKYLNSGSELCSITHEKLGIYEETYKFLMNYSINSYYSNVLSLLYDKVKTVPTGTCPPFRRKLFLNTQNQLLPCEKVSHNHSLGMVDDNVNIDIHKISEKYNFYYRHIKNICNQCYEAKACPVCLLSLEHLDKLGSENFICPSFSDEKTFENKTNRIFSFLEKYPTDLFKMIENSLID